MNIVKASANLTPKEIYNLTSSPAVQKMRDAVGSLIEIEKYAFYEDVNRKTGEVQEILAIQTPDGEIFATNSPTFKDDFKSMIELFEGMGEEVHAISVMSGSSKAGRQFITCCYEN